MGAMNGTPVVYLKEQQILLVLKFLSGLFTFFFVVEVESLTELGVLEFFLGLTRVGI